MEKMREWNGEDERIDERIEERERKAAKKDRKGRQMQRVVGKFKRR